MGWTFPDNEISIDGVITADNTWRDIDVSTLVPAGTKAIIIHTRNPYAAGREVAFRPNGATDDRVSQLIQGTHKYFYVKLDNNYIFEGRLRDTNPQNTIVGYTTNDYGFSTSTDLSTGTTGSYVDTNISSYVPEDATGAFLEIYTASKLSYNTRKNGSSDDNYFDNYQGGKLAVVGLDANRIFEQKIETTGVDIYLWGYLGPESNFADSYTDLTPAYGSWQDIDCSSYVSASAIAAIFRIENTTGSDWYGNLRKKGSTDNNITGVGVSDVSHIYAVVGLDANKFCQAYFTASLGGFYFYLIGYIDASGTPSIVIDSITNIGANSAIGNAEVLSDGGDIVTERGFCWSTSINPTTADDKIIVSGTIGSYSGNITGLTQTTTYHVRAYAINAIGTAYSADLQFDTLFEKEEEPFSQPINEIILGSYTVPDDDIIEVGEIQNCISQDFSVTTSGVTLILDNKTGKYSPGKSNFIWAGATWYNKEVIISLSYQDSGTSFIIFKGIIKDWKVNEIKDAAYDSTPEGETVEITIDDHCSLLENRIIGKLNNDGSPNPFVHGHIFRQAETLGPKTFWLPKDYIDYETGDLTQVDEVFGTGTTVVTDDPYEGTYCAKHEDDAASAYCRQEIAISGTDEIHLSALIKFTSMPAGDPTDNGIWFLGIQDTIGQFVTWLTLGSNDDGEAGFISLGVVYHGFEISNIRLEDHLNEWMKFDIIIRNDTPNLQSIIKLFIDDDEIVSVNYSAYLSNHFRYATWGIYHFGAPQAGWIMYSDEVKCYDVCYPLGYYLPGFPYQELVGVYIDGIWWPKYNKPKYPILYIGGKQVFNKLIYKGKSSLPKNYRVNLDYGLIDFLDFENQPTGSILLDIIKDNIEHPVDLIESILEEVELDSRIDATNFSDVKTANPNDKLGIYIDDQSSSDVISNICQYMLLNLYEFEGDLKLLSYTGTPLISSILTVSQDNCHSMEQTIDMSEVMTEIQVKWGWYDQSYKKLFYRIQNTAMISIIGNQTYDFDLSYGQDISTSDEIIAKAKADLLLKRIGGPYDIYTIGGNLTLARLEPGDGVLVRSSFNDDDLIYQVIEKVVNLMDKTVEIKVCRYMGEDTYYVNNNLIHTQSISLIALTQHHYLIDNNLSHTQSLTELILSDYPFLTNQDLSHSHSLENIILS